MDPADESQELIRWSRLGRPEVEGDVEVAGVGIVVVKERDIESAGEQGGDPYFQLIDTTVPMDRVKCYRLGHMVPGEAASPAAQSAREANDVQKAGPPGQPLRVFVSSTFEDLEDHRKAVIDALTQMGADVRGMENFGAQPNPIKDVCLQQVRESEVYVGLFGTRYGTIDEETGKSFTELEYREALRLRLDIRIYFPHPDWAIPAKYWEQDGGRAMALSKLKAQLSGRHTPDYFNEPQHLATRVCTALFPDRPPPPWLMSDEPSSVPKPEVVVKSARDAWYFVTRKKDLSDPRLWVGCTLRFANQSDRDSSIERTELTATVDGHGSIPLAVQPPLPSIERRNPPGEPPLDWAVLVPFAPIRDSDEIVEVRPGVSVDRFVFAVAEGDVGADVGAVTIHIKCTDYGGRSSSAEALAVCRHGA